jgi:hypothetical protein
MKIKLKYGEKIITIFKEHEELVRKWILYTNMNNTAETMYHERLILFQDTVDLAGRSYNLRTEVYNTVPQLNLGYIYEAWEIVKDEN